jgi:lysophospholipase L1-like esterase
VRRRILIALLLVVGLPVAVLAVEVQMARTGERLDDEEGFRPERLVVRAGPDPTRVVWLGDSTATGVGAGDVTGSMAHRVTARFTDAPVTLTILGRSGAQVHEVLDDQLPLLQATDADVVFVSIGANDVTALTRDPTFRSRYRRMVTTIEELARGAEIVLVGIPDIGTAPRLAVPLRQIAGWRGAQLDDEIARVARQRGHRHVDLADRTGPIFSSDPERYFAADDYHPSSDGHEVWADAVLASLAS